MHIIYLFIFFFLSKNVTFLLELRIRVFKKLINDDTYVCFIFIFYINNTNKAHILNNS